MIHIKKEGILLQKTNLDFENDGVLNPAVIRQGDSVHIYYRAVQKGNRSCIGYCRLDGPLHLVERRNTPILSAEFDYESQGVEDARIVKIDDIYYLSYTAYDGTNARGALATSTDLINFQKQGIIVPPITYAEFTYLVESAGRVNENYYRNHSFYYQDADPEKKIMLWDKNVVFFPRRIKGQLCFLHRIRPGIQITYINKLSDLTKPFWRNYCMNLQDHILMDPQFKHEANYIGAGCPPIETPYGWLLIYHGVESNEAGNVYSACAALLDLENPSLVLARLPKALFAPHEDWELNGEVNNVVFPTGTAVFGDTLYIYYGAADSQIACASTSLSALVAELLTHPSPHAQ